jgi:hypothetical protein
MSTTFDEWWEDYCQRTAHSFTEERGVAEEVWNAAQEAARGSLTTGDEENGE